MPQYVVSYTTGTYHSYGQGVTEGVAATGHKIFANLKEAAQESTKRMAEQQVAAEAGKSQREIIVSQIPDHIQSPDQIKQADLKKLDPKAHTELVEHIRKQNPVISRPSPSRTSFARSQAGHARPGLLGAVAAVGTVVAGTLASGQKVHAAEVVDQILPTNFQGGKSLCHQFGEVAGVFAQVALPAVGGLTSGPVGLAAGLAASEVTGRLTHKLTDMACGPR